MKLSKKSYEWAINHIKKQRDTDLFPKLKEYEVLFENEQDLINELSEIDLSNYKWQHYRRFIIPRLK